ncbi:uncharacterized protein BX664DRAFT_338081 [Halteromyces radiatus]|uniref:uncharacterized protein n=1 Tax=Halteromyces radiatus TaxID=101107 RepID=UPI00221FF0C6|nr:uncharacterized protein BX664DRAFT_338081 [Halteromyces radiatus]KAI8084905.1 hypothetical protein BX664DRAFT_338081 [Halteromyces radiatus]
MSSKGKEQELKKNISKATETAQENIDKASNATQEGLEKASKTAQEEVVRLRQELDDLRSKANPKIRKAEDFLTSPTSCSFYQGVLVGAGLVFLYAKYIAPPNSGLKL